MIVRISKIMSPHVYHGETYCFTPLCLSVRLSVRSSVWMSHFCECNSSYIARRIWMTHDTKQDDDEYICTKRAFRDVYKSYDPLHLDSLTIVSCERNSSYISRRIWTKQDDDEYMSMKGAFYVSSIFARVVALYT
jgi:hypothetical protein